MQRFGRRDQDMRRMTEQALPFDGGRVTRADGDGDFRQRLLHLLGQGRDAEQRDLQVAINVVVERFERGDVENLDAARYWVLAPQPVEASKKGGERLARAGWREQQRAFSRRDDGPTLALNGSRFAQARLKPRARARQSLVDDAYSRITPKRTTIFLPTRLSTLRRCDEIVFLHKGRIEAIGSHNRLVASSPMYRHWEYLKFNEFRHEVEGA